MVSSFSTFLNISFNSYYKSTSQDISAPLVLLDAARFCWILLGIAHQFQHSDVNMFILKHLASKPPARRWDYRFGPKFSSRTSSREQREQKETICKGNSETKLSALQTHSKIRQAESKIRIKTS